MQLRTSNLNMFISRYEPIISVARRLTFSFLK